MAQEKAFTTEEINGAVRKHLSTNKPVKIGGLDGHSGVLAGLRGKGRVTISGKAGPYLAAYLDGPEVSLAGSAGDYAGSTMVSGLLVIEGTVGKGLCCHMVGGLARVKGRVGASAGAMMSGGQLILDSPIGPGPGEGMTGGTMVLLRPNHLPKQPPSLPARLIVPRGTSKDVQGFAELELDHQEVAALSKVLGDAGVTSPDKVADLLVILIREGEHPLPGTGSVPRRRDGEVGVTPEVTRSGDAGDAGGAGGASGAGVAGNAGEAGEAKGAIGGNPSGGKDVDASSRFANFAKHVKDGEDR